MKEQNCCTDKLEEISDTLDDSDFGYFLEVDLSYPNIIKEETKKTPFACENKIMSKYYFNKLMKKTKSKIHISHEKLVYDWAEKKK